jgi:SAM-dependent methyltransferase
MLEEARRVLRPGGQFLVSTPNKDFYSETRRLSGPNPYHHHEFQFENFRAALTKHFPYVRIFVQNHASGVVFQPVDTDHGNLMAAAGAELCVDRSAADASTAHFFLAVCALSPQTGAPTFVYVPTTANVLREREHHILRLEQELTTKDGWLAEAQAEHQALLARHHELAAELNQRTDWAQQLDNQLKAARHRIVALQDELDAEQASAREVVRGYEEVIRTLETTIEQNLLTAQQSQLRLEADLAAQCAALDAKCNELSACVSLLHSVEATVEERTQWARALEAELEALRAHLREAGGSRWIRLGRSLGLGPELRQQ